MAFFLGNCGDGRHAPVDPSLRVIRCPKKTKPSLTKPAPDRPNAISARWSAKAWPDPIGPSQAPEKLAYPARSEGIVAKTGEEHVVLRLRRESKTGEGIFLGEGILKTAREPAKGTFIDVLPETAGDLPDHFGIAGTDGGELDLAPRVVIERVAIPD